MLFLDSSCIGIYLTVPSKYMLSRQCKDEDWDEYRYWKFRHAGVLPKQNSEKLQVNLLEKNYENYQSGQLEVDNRDLQMCAKDHSTFTGTETTTNDLVNKQYNKLPSN